jgi:hypothetical protein
MGKMKELSIQKDNGEEWCAGCEFVAQFSPHDGGYCQVHGDIKGTPKRDMGAATIIDKLGGNDLSLEEDV